METGVVELAPFAQTRNLAPEDMPGLADMADVAVVGPPRAAVALTRGRLAELCEDIVAVLEEWHRKQPETLGPTRAAILARRPGRAPEAALDAALATLVEAGRVARGGGMWRLAGHEPRLTHADERLWQRLQPLLAAGGRRPPRVRELAAELTLDPGAVERLLVRAEHLGRVGRVAGNRFFPSETVAHLVEVAAELARASPTGSFTAAEFKDRSGVGRNLTIEILEYLDRIGATRRIGDARIVVGDNAAPHRLD